MEEKRVLFYVTEITKLGDLGDYLRDSSLDDMGCMFHIRGARIGGSENIYEDVEGYQALGTKDESQITNPAFRLNVGKQYGLLSDCDVIYNPAKSITPFMVALKYFSMKQDGLAPNEINQELMDKYNERKIVTKAPQKVK